MLWDFMAPESQWNLERAAAIRKLATDLNSTDWMVVHVGEGGECSLCGHQTAGGECHCANPVVLDNVRIGEVLENVGRGVKQLAAEDFFPNGTIIAAKLRIRRTNEPITFFQVDRGHLIARSSEDLVGTIDWKRVVQILDGRAEHLRKTKEFNAAMDFGGD
jgi:hypothetical protein